MSKKNETARTDARTAGKTAKSDTKPRRVWRKRTINGVLTLFSPDGRKFYGTPREVRDAALYPWQRKSLAASIRNVRVDFADDRDCLNEACREARMDAIRERSMYALCGDRENDRRIIVAACARLTGEKEDEFRNNWVDAGIEAIIDAVENYDLPMTRHERAALKSPLSSWCDSLARRERATV